MSTLVSTEKSNSLVHHLCRNNDQYQFNIEVSLRDECKNGHQDFHITGSMWPAGKVKSERNLIAAWSIGDRIAAVFPEFALFDRLHGCDYLGQPMHTVANGVYHIKEGKEKSMSCLRITEDEYEALKNVVEEGHLAILLEDMGIRARWQNEAAKAIAQLEEWTGKAFLCDSVRSNWPNAEKMAEYRALQAEGYYTIEATTMRRTEAVVAKYTKRGQDIKRDKEKAIEKATMTCDIKTAILDAGYLCDNFIWYDHTNQIAFNWQSYGDKFKQESIDSLMVILKGINPGLTLKIEKA